MSFPTSTLVAQYEPFRWAYSDGDVINTSTKKFVDSSGNGHDLADAVTGSPVYKTNITPSGKAVVRFSGGMDVRGNWITGATNDHSVYAVVIPRTGFSAAGGDCVCCWVDTATGNFHGFLAAANSGTVWRTFETEAGGGHLLAQASGTGWVIDTPQIVGALRYALTTGNPAWAVRVDRAEVATTVPVSILGGGVNHFNVGSATGQAGHTSELHGDVAAVFVYSSVLTGQDLTDLETYLWQTYIQVATIDVLSPGSYSLSGQNIVTQTLLEHVAPGSFTLTGQNVAQAYGQPVAPGSFSLTGQVVTEVAGAESAPGEGAAGPRIWLPQPHGFHGGRR